MTADLTGGCACGAIRYATPGPVRFAMVCQCSACQKNTGSGNAVQFAVPADTFAVEGEPATWSRGADSGHEVTKAFCPTCGCPIYGRPTRMPEIAVVMAGSLDDPSQITPSMIVFSERAQPWDTITLPES